MKRSYYLTLFFSLITLFKINGQNGTKQSIDQDSVANTFPVPPANKHMLFYLQRTHNINTIIYELNYNADSTLNEKEPVKVYWIRYADHGEIVPLSGIQKKFAYGVNSTLVDKEKKWFKINLIAYKKRSVFLIKSKENKGYHAYVYINGILTVMTRVFIKIDGGSFWNPNVVYIELKGKDITTGKTVLERFKP